MTSSTPFPVPSFQNAASDASPTQFLGFLKTLVSENLEGDPSIRIPSTNRASWVTVISGLSDHFLASFPTLNVVPWNAMREKLELIEITLEIIQRVTIRVDAMYSSPDEAAKKTFVPLLSLCTALDSWIDADINIEDGILTPSHLRVKAFEAGVGILRHMGQAIATDGGSDESTWRSLKSILVECLEVVQGEHLRNFAHGRRSHIPDCIALPGPFQTPISIIMFSKPRFQEVSTAGSDVFSQVCLQSFRCIIVV